MSGTPDYGPRDWVVCIRTTGLCGIETKIMIGSKMATKEIFRPGHIFSNGARLREWGVSFFGIKNTFPDGTECPYPARCFRKLDPATDLPQSITTKKKVTP